MPSWLTPVLQWGGLALAIVSAAALINAAPVTLYWVLLVIGVVGAVIGFVLGRRKPTGGAES